MVSLRLVFLFATLAFAHGHTRGAAPIDDVAELEDDTEDLTLAHAEDVARMLKGKKKNLQDGGSQKSKKSGGGGGHNRNPTGDGGDGYSVAEDHECVDFNDEMKARASLSLSDENCRLNQCNGGCCRVYHWLICDENNEMPQLSCVCNGNTRPKSTPPPVSPRPTPAPVTAMPTPPPTDAATSDTRSNPPAASPVAAGQATSAPVTRAPVPQTPAPTPTALAPSPANNGGATEPPYVGGAPPDACASGSPHHANPLFRDFTRCFSSQDCPLATECCIHSFCFCGEPDNWDGDCIGPTTDIQK